MTESYSAWMKKEIRKADPFLCPSSIEAVRPIQAPRSIIIREDGDREVMAHDPTYAQRRARAYVRAVESFGMIADDVKYRVVIRGSSQTSFVRIVLVNPHPVRKEAK